jgi:hypothetical protein
LEIFATSQPRLWTISPTLVFKIVLAAEVALKEYAFAMQVGLDITATWLTHSRKWSVHEIVLAEAFASMDPVFVTPIMTVLIALIIWAERMSHVFQIVTVTGSVSIIHVNVIWVGQGKLVRLMSVIQQNATALAASRHILTTFHARKIAEHMVHVSIVSASATRVGMVHFVTFSVAQVIPSVFLVTWIAVVMASAMI